MNTRTLNPSDDSRTSPAGTAAPPRLLPLQRVRLWDLPTRLFHWSLALAVTTALVSGKIGGDWMDLHRRAGLSVLGLLAFRLLWGFVGGTHARFASFWPTPSRLRAYVQGHWQGLGHNPLGALSVFALLAALAWQAGTGLFSNDDIAFTGPLNVLVSEDLAGRLTRWHRLGTWGLFLLVGLHLVAIAWHLHVKKRDLVTPMVTGYATVPAGGALAVRRANWAALLVALLSALAAVFLASGGMLAA